MNKSLYILVCFVLLSGCGKNGEKVLFEAIPPAISGITFRNDISETNKLNILDYLYFYNGGGVATGDINNDGFPDIYFSGNQLPNKLYLNKGNFVFEDITKSAGVAGKNDWSTGAVMADVNGDGFLDIYVLAVVGVNGFRGHNELFINNCNATFTERSSEFGLDLDNFSSSAAFFDYDNDGDLDLYLLNHAVHTADSFGPANIRNNRSYESGDKLYRNDGNRFTDVSEEAGIFGGPNAYGLGITTADFNNDGFTDIYVSNDFHEDDYFYLNNGDGTFREALKEFFGHTSRFSMGSDAGDTNHNGFMDLFTLDMLSDNEKVLKTSVGDDDIALSKFRTESLKYHPQYARNMLQVNQKGTFFAETALMEGVAATDWSWSALFADFDQDTHLDLFISNGIPIRPNNLDFINYISDDQIKKKLENTRLVDQTAIEMMPSGKTTNVIFKGDGQSGFVNNSEGWIPETASNSNGTAYSDLDNDGDLDLVINNLNDAPFLLKNKTNQSKNYLKIKFRTDTPNSFGIGTKAYIFYNGKMQYKQLFTSRGFQSSSEPVLHFGLDTISKIDSLIVVWTDKTYQKHTLVKANQTMTISPEKVRDLYYGYKEKVTTKKWFKRSENDFGLNFIHLENDFNDFDRQKLIPYRISDRGPAVAIGDIDANGLEDVFFGSSKFNAAKLYLQKKNGFELAPNAFHKDEDVAEEVDAVFSDTNGNGYLDLFAVSGGGEFYGKMDPLLDRLFINDGKGNLVKSKALPEYFENGSVIRPNDFDQDGDIDFFVGNGSVSYDFGKIPDSYLLNNQNGKFSIVNQQIFKSLGMITDAVWIDFDGDGIKDLIVVGEWMNPTFLKNNKGTFEDVTLQYLPESLKGLWQVIQLFDIDNDGQVEFLLGNWGLNTKFKATKNFPLKMNYGDFDGNGSTESVVSIAKGGKYYTLASLDELSSQMLFLKKKYTSYESFAGKTIEEIFGESLSNTNALTVDILESGYLKKSGTTYKFVPFQKSLQVAPIRTMLVFDFDRNGKDEVLLAGNYFGVIPFHGRFDSFPGAVIKQGGKIIDANDLGINFTQKQVNDLSIIEIDGETYVLATFNNEAVALYKMNLGK